MLKKFRAQSESVRFFTILFLVLFVLAFIFRYWNGGYHNIVNSDGRGYYAYLPAIFIYHDLDYEFFYNGTLNLEKEYTSNFLFLIDGHDVIKYPSGMALLLIPFFLLAMILSFLTLQPVDGYSFWFQICVSLGAITYTTLGAVWLRQTLLKLKSDRKAALVVTLSIIFGTNLTIYCVRDPSISHAYSFGMAALFIYSIARFRESNKSVFFLAASFAIGTIILIRPVNAIIVFAVFAVMENMDAFKKMIQQLFKKPALLVSGILLTTAIVAIQPLLWYLQNGHWYVYTYMGETFNFSDPKIMKTLFSYRKGWFLYTPMMALIFPGLLVMAWQKKYVQFISVFLLFAVALYILSSWWCWYYGGSFGQRTYIDFYPVFAIPIFYFLSSTRVNKVVVAGMIVLAAFNLIQSYQLKNNIIHYDSMTREGYWKVFLKTGKEYEFSLFGNPYDSVDSEISGQTKARYFQDFEYNKTYWKYGHPDDIADEAHSGNHVISLRRRELETYFELHADSVVKSMDSPLRIRFSAWFSGATDEFEINLELSQPSGINMDRRIHASDLVCPKNTSVWKRCYVDIDLPGISRDSLYIRADFIPTKTGELHMDDAMFVLYEPKGSKD